jgi:succinate dehydrogenase/fumarate reductase cytochrome b subunit
MAGNTQMNESERGLFSLMHGITGYLVAVVLLLSILAGLTIGAISVQNAEATNYYSINQDINGLKFIDSSENQYKNYKLIGK